MKKVIELKKNIKDRAFFLAQFERTAEKNMLFVNPPLSGRYLYRDLIPYFELDRPGKCCTAITNISEFGVPEQLTSFLILDMFSPENIHDDKFLMIQWATHIIFPFTIQPLSEIYNHIREINPKCKILFNVDTNFMELPPNNPLFDLFNDKEEDGPVIDMAKNNAVDNCYFADTILVSIRTDQEYFTQLFKYLQEPEEKYYKVKRNAINNPLKIHVLALGIKEEMMLENVDHLSEEDGDKSKAPAKKASKKKRENKPKIKKVIKRPILKKKKITNQ